MLHPNYLPPTLGRYHERTGTDLNLPDQIRHRGSSELNVITFYLSPTEQLTLTFLYVLTEPLPVNNLLREGGGGRTLTKDEKSLLSVPVCLSLPHLFIFSVLFSFSVSFVFYSSLSIYSLPSSSFPSYFFLTSYLSLPYTLALTHSLSLSLSLTHFSSPSPLTVLLDVFCCLLLSNLLAFSPFSFFFSVWSF